MKTKIVLFALLNLFLLAACAASPTQGVLPTTNSTQPPPILPSQTPSPSGTPTPLGQPINQTSDLVGVWQITTHPDFPIAYWTVREDGSYTFSPTPDSSSHGQSGKYQFEENVFLISDDFCPEQGRYAARRIGEENNPRLVFTLIEDNCPARLKILTGAPIERFASEIASATTRPPTATFAPTPSPLALAESLDIPYTSELSLDVYWPQQPGKWPVVVFLHGGDLNKDAIKGVSRVIAGQGAVVFAPTWHSGESNVLDKQGLPVGYNDAACAVRFARTKAAEYGGNPMHLVLIGHSAGGAAGATITLAGGDFTGDCVIQEGPALPDAFIGLDGAYDLPRYASPSNYKQNPQAWERLSPYNYIDRQPIRPEVRFYINVGTEQELVADGKRLAEALKTAGYPVVYQEFPGTDHMSMASARPDLMLMVMQALSSH